MQLPERILRELYLSASNSARSLDRLLLCINEHRLVPNETQAVGRGGDRMVKSFVHLIKYHAHLQRHTTPHPQLWMSTVLFGPNALNDSDRQFRRSLGRRTHLSAAIAPPLSRRGH